MRLKLLRILKTIDFKIYLQLNFANIVLNSFLEFKYENFIQNLYFNYFIFNKRYS